MVIIDKETIDQYKLEVLTARKKFAQFKDYGPKFRRIIKILTEEGHLIQDERLNNYYLIKTFDFNFFETPQVGFEPTTNRLTVGRSTPELLRKYLYIL